MKMSKVVELKGWRNIERLHFNIPCLCLFRHETDIDEDYHVGVLVDNDVICMCCGARMPLDEIEYLRYKPDEWPVDADTMLYPMVCDEIGQPEEEM